MSHSEPMAGGLAWPVRDGWRTELIPFPIEFAQELPYRGVEDIRFHPDFFKASRPGWWSYAIAWACSVDDPTPRMESLAADLTTYWDGLARAVAGDDAVASQPAAVDLPPGDARSRRAGHPTERCTGTATVLDPFATRGPVRLRLEIERWVCPVASATFVLVLASPLAPSTPTWGDLHEVGASLECHLEDG